MQAKAQNEMTRNHQPAPFDEDAALMFQVANGSEHAFRMIVEKWQRPLMNYFFRSCRDAHFSEDMAQQTFLNLFRAREAYAEYLSRDIPPEKPKAKFSTYLFRIARNVLITEYRKKARRPAEAMDPSEMEFGNEVSESSSVAELEEIFYSSVERLPENHRTAILLLKQQQISYEEIAEIMKSNVQSVKTWIHRARAALRQALQNAENPEKGK